LDLQTVTKTLAAIFDYRPVQAIVDVLSFTAVFDEIRFPQNAEMPTDCRLRAAQLGCYLTDSHLSA
jgi:hypothetical protein